VPWRGKTPAATLPRDLTAPNLLINYPHVPLIVQLDIDRIRRRSALSKKDEEARVGETSYSSTFQTKAEDRKVE
jgi:hypothetical protein